MRLMIMLIPECYALLIVLLLLLKPHKKTKPAVGHHAVKNTLLHVANHVVLR